jgi:hypothetical protein
VTRFGRMMAFAGFVAMAMTGAVSAAESPKFEIDTSWPKPLQKNWIFGQIGGIFVDKDDNVWITQRPRTVNKRDRRARTAIIPSAARPPLRSSSSTRPAM